MNPPLALSFQHLKVSLTPSLRSCQLPCSVRIVVVFFLFSHPSHSSGIAKSPAMYGSICTPSSRYLQPIVNLGTLLTSTPTRPMVTPSTMARTLLTYFLVDTNPTVTNANKTSAHSSGMPIYITILV